MTAATQRYPAPAVQFPLRRSPVLAGALTFLNAAALLVLLAWMSAGAGADRRTAGPALLLWAVVAVLAARFWTRLPVGTLVWDGQGWELQGTGSTAAPQPLGSVVVIQLDLQRRMALAFPEGHPAVWLFVERSQDAARWLDLRRAVYSRATAALSDSAAQAAGDAAVPDRRV